MVDEAAREVEALPEEDVEAICDVASMVYNQLVESFSISSNRGHRSPV